MKNLRTPHLVLVVMALALALSGCNNPESPWGFSLPDGNADQGMRVFAELKCTHCHSVAGLDLDGPAERELHVVLGGEVTRVKTYGELVTSVINPSHRLAQGYEPEEVSEAGVSKMRSYNDTMTVTQLVDLVAFLQPQYELPEYVPTEYPLYP